MSGRRSAAGGSIRPRLFGAYVHTLRWHCVTATDPNLFQAPFWAGIRIDAYQLEPLRKCFRELYIEERGTAGALDTVWIRCCVLSDGHSFGS